MVALSWAELPALGEAATLPPWAQSLGNWTCVGKQQVGIRCLSTGVLDPAPPEVSITLGDLTSLTIHSS